MKNLWLVEEYEDDDYTLRWSVSDGSRYYDTADSSDAEWLCETLNAIEGFKEGEK